MKIDIVTLFPELFNDFLNTSIISKAQQRNLVEIQVTDLRDYSKRNHKQVDDTPYGGGVGMLLDFPSIYDCIEDLKTEKSKVILMSPQGKLFNQETANTLAVEKHIILIAGHYEGFDARIEEIIDEEISIGDYVLTGGEIPAMVITDAVTRLIPGVIMEASVKEDSLYEGILKYPQYTKPYEYKGYKVPDVLLSGHHANIEKWRKKMAIEVTMKKRPDLLKKNKDWNSILSLI